jgi:hypothetical protein
MEVSAQLHATIALARGEGDRGMHLICGWLYHRTGLYAVANILIILGLIF